MAILQFKIKSEELDSKTDVIVILPTKTVEEMRKLPDYGFYRQGKCYQVLYLYHGTTGDCWDWLRFSRIEKYAQDHCLAIVMPTVYNSNFHDIPDSYPWYRYAAKELPRIISWTFPISNRREDTFIAGLSMGGSGAFKIAMENPEQYGAVASLSGAFQLAQWIEQERKAPWAAAYGPDEKLLGTMEDPYWQAAQIVAQKIDHPKLYLCCGTEDPICYDSNRQFHAHLQKIGFEHTYHEQPGGHDWDFWDSEIQLVLNWLPLKNELVER